MFLEVTVCLALSCKTLSYPMESMNYGLASNPIVMEVSPLQCNMMAGKLLNDIRNNYPRYEIKRWECK